MDEIWKGICGVIRENMGWQGIYLIRKWYFEFVISRTEILNFVWWAISGSVPQMSHFVRKAYFWMCGVPEYANQSTPGITFWAVYAWSDHKRVQTDTQCLLIGVIEIELGDWCEEVALHVSLVSFHAYVPSHLGAWNRDPWVLKITLGKEPWCITIRHLK